MIVLSALQDYSFQHFPASSSLASLAKFTMFFRSKTAGSRLLPWLLCAASVMAYAVPQLAAAERPALIVVVSVDQLCYEYLERFYKNFDAQGVFRRCEAEGVWMTNCRHQHAFTYTAPGHAVQLTGCYPSEHGIIENDWWDRTLGKKTYCVFDPDAKLIGTTASDTPVSPRRLYADTLGDRLKILSGGKSKVFGVAIKDRASILMAGHQANAAIWMSNDGKSSSSTSATISKATRGKHGIACCRRRSTCMARRKIASANVLSTT
jgi:hypothetical protein